METNSNNLIFNALKHEAVALSPIYFSGEPKRDENRRDTNKMQQMAHGSVMTTLFLTMVWRKFIRNYNVYASVLGLCMVSDIT